MSGEDTGVQSDPDQGAEDGSQGFYQDYLQNNVPDDYRPHVEGYLKEIEGNTNAKFREHSDYRKQWEPYSELGLSDYEPEQIETLLSFAQMVSDESQGDNFAQWWNAIGQERGLLNNENDEGGDEDGELDLSSMSPDQLREMLTEVVDQRVGPLEQNQQTKERNELVSDANEAIESQMKEIEGTHGELSESAKQHIYKVAYALSETSDDPLGDAHKEYMDMVSEVQKSTVNGSLDTPKPPAPGGGPADTNTESPKTMEEASQMARVRLAALNK